MHDSFIHQSGEPTAVELGLLSPSEAWGPNRRVWARISAVQESLVRSAAARLKPSVGQEALITRVFCHYAYGVALSCLRYAEQKLGNEMSDDYERVIFGLYKESLSERYLGLDATWLANPQNNPLMRPVATNEVRDIGYFGAEGQLACRLYDLMRQKDLMKAARKERGIWPAIHQAYSELGITTSPIARDFPDSVVRTQL